MKIIYAKSINEIPGYQLMQMVRDEPGWEARAVADKRLDTRIVYKLRADYRIPFKKQPEGSEI